MKTKPHPREEFNSANHYGTVFQENASLDPVVLGKKQCEDAIAILENRLTENRDLRRLPLSPDLASRLKNECIAFLKEEAAGTFESDNLKHVGRLISHMKRYAPDLKETLDVLSDDAILLAALHDLGKGQSVPAMEEYLTTIFNGEFINLRVLPHELYSMYWIQKLSRKLGIPDAVAHTLMDQIANHNFGPNLSDPANRHFLQSAPGAPHWWVKHWSDWATKANTEGLKVNSVYGSPESPLALTLVFFDRVDGGHPHSWEKFLNQDVLSGEMQFSAENIIQILEDSQNTSREQVIAVAEQLKVHFRKKVELLNFRPFTEAIEMLDRSKQTVDQLKRCNTEEVREKLNITVPNAILYQDKKGVWIRIDGAPGVAAKYRWENNRWRLSTRSDRPVALFLEAVYLDWK